jgi:YHS domain-containing protein
MLKNLPAAGPSDSGRASAEIDDVMVKDPYCEVYFPKRKGIQLKVKGEDLYFCSPECRDKFIESKSDQ